MQEDQNHVFPEPQANSQTPPRPARPGNNQTLPSTPPQNFQTSQQNQVPNSSANQQNQSTNNYPQTTNTEQNDQGIPTYTNPLPQAHSRPINIKILLLDMRRLMLVKDSPMFKKQKIKTPKIVNCKKG